MMLAFLVWSLPWIPSSLAWRGKPAFFGHRGGAVKDTAVPLGSSDGFSSVPVKTRHTSDFLVDLLTRSRLETTKQVHEATELRSLLMESVTIYDDPQQLLHFFSPKLPAIKHSPEISIRIRCSKADMDPGIAACLMGALGCMSESSSNEATCAILDDRRLEQVFETMVSGINVKKQLSRFEKLQQNETVDDDTPAYKKGLSIRDCCRAAWGAAILGLHEKEKFGGENVAEVLIALGMRCRELLLFQYHELQTSDLVEGTRDSIDLRLEDVSEELAEDAATVMWTFACVRACSGTPSSHVMNACEEILCADPIDARRAVQESETDVAATLIGSNDIVDRLAEVSEVNSDEDEDIQSLNSPASSALDPVTSLGDRKEVLLDWLSPKELTDCIWALAVHGRTNEIGCIDTEGTFCEIVFDRLLDWLRLERRPNMEINENAKFERSNCEETTVSAVSQESSLSLDSGMGSVAEPSVTELLAVESTLGNTSPQVVELMEVTGDDGQDGTHQIRVVNAADLLASEAGPQSEGINGSVDQQAEANCGQLDHSGKPGKDAPSDTSLRFFSPHDLCSIAWAVTELSDSLRGPVVLNVMELVEQRGPDCLRGLSGGNLSSVAWAIAKIANYTDGSIRSDELAVLVSGWVVDEVLGEQRSANSDLLRRFYPPEFSRLLWAIATVYGARVDGTRVAGTDAFDLARIGMEAAVSDVEIFGTEDLARIVWALLSFSENSFGEKRLLANEDALVLGRMVAVIETNLRRWERGDLSSQVSISEAKEATRFVSFFGRTRVNAQLFDHGLNDESSDDSQDTSEDKSHLPLLRDLPIDPLTLCKIACCSERLSDRQTGIRPSETLTRVALRVLTSRGGRLMMECPMQDLVRLCEAASRTQFSTLREMISHFARRLVQHLNSGRLEDVSTLGVGDVATLIWALGELGVKYRPDEDTSTSPHRRLHLVKSLPFLGGNQLIVLSNSRFIKMLKGIVNMQVVSSDFSRLPDLLGTLETRVATLSDESDICDALESVASLRAFVSNAQKKSETAPETTESLTREVLDTTVASCDRMASLLSKRASEVVSTLHAFYLRKILSTLVALGGVNSHTETEVVGVFEKEVNRRRALLTTGRSDYFVLGNESEGQTAGDLFSDGTLIGKSDVAMHELTMNNNDKGTGTKVQAGALNTLVGLSNGLANSRQATRDVTNHLSQGLLNDILYDIGRCSELIAEYRRMVDSGARKKRSSFAKRMLSRHLP